MKLFDAHCHLHFPQFDADRADVLARMQALDMGAVIIGTDFTTSRAAVALAEKHDFLWATVGLHPNDNQDENFDKNYEALASHPKVVGIGECGLDYFRSGSTSAERVSQQERFETQIQTAEKLHKTIVVHCRHAQQIAANSTSAHEDCLRMLQASKVSVPVIAHFFTGSKELAQRYLDLGCYLSFPGPITYTEMYDDSIRAAPMDRLLVETDAPYAAPVPYRGRRNEPTYVEEVVRKIAIVKGLSTEEVARQTVLNSQRVFGLQ